MSNRTKYVHFERVKDMKHYRELKAYKELNKKLTSLESFIRKRDPEFLEHNRELLYSVLVLKDTVKNYYTKDEKGKYRKPTKGGLNNIKQCYDSALMALNLYKEAYNANEKTKDTPAPIFGQIEDLIKADQLLVDKMSHLDNLTLPQLAFKYDKEIKKNDYQNGQFKWPGFAEYSRIYTRSKKSEDDVLQEYINKTPEQVAETYKHAIDNTVRFYEYVNMDNVPLEIRNASDADTINNYLAEHGNELNYRQQVKLRKQVEVAAKVQAIENEATQKMNANQEMGEKPELISRGPNDAELKIDMPAKQTSGSGCWSCASQMMIASRGIKNISQEDVRLYRPKEVVGEDVMGVDDEAILMKKESLDYAYNSDGVKNMMEMGDSLLSFIPNSMIRNMEIQRYNRDAEERGITREEYIDKTIELMKKQILHALKVDRSPVSLVVPGHYITIMGIDGDKLKYKDSASSGKANDTHTMSLSAFINDQFKKSTYEKRVVGSIQLSWVSDIKLSKADKKTIHGVPSVYVEMNDDGTIKLPPEDVHSSAKNTQAYEPQNKKGVRIHRGGGDEAAAVPRDFDEPYDTFKNFGIQVMERVYLPKKLNVNYLRTQAENRTNEEEEILKAADKDLYRIPENREEARQKIDDYRTELRNKEAGLNNQQPQPQVDDNHVQGMIQNMINANGNNYGRFKGYPSTLEDAHTVLNGLSAHNSSFIPKKKIEYDQIIESMGSIIEQLGRATVQGANFKGKDARKLLATIDKAIKSTKTYLDKKHKELEKDPTRKFSSGKQKTEQPRIKNAVAALDFLVQTRMAVDSYVFQNRLSNSFREQNKKVVEGYKNELVAEMDDPKKDQKASYKNRIELSDEHRRHVDLMDGIWGKDRMWYGEFETRFKKDEKNNSLFQKIHTLEGSLGGIGAGGKKDMLTNKDYAALSVAASTLPEAFKFVKDQHKFEHNNLVSDKTIYQAEKCKLAEFTMVFSDKDMSNDINAINASKVVAERAVRSYQKGDIKPLAKLIKDGMSNMIETAKKDTFLLSNDYLYNTPNMQIKNLYFAEMCERMKGMMERDPKLMSAVFSAGLKPDDYNYIESMKEIGINAVKVDSIKKDMAKVVNGQSPEWTDAEKLERYTDLLTNLAYKDSVRILKNQVERSPEYKDKLKTINESIQVEVDKVNKEYADFIKVAFSEDPVSKQLLDTLNENLKTADEKGKESLHRQFREATHEHIYHRLEDMNTYEQGILQKYKTKFEIMDRDRQAEHKPVMTQKEKITAALEFEKTEVERYNVFATDEEKAALDKQKADYNFYNKCRVNITPFTTKHENIEKKLEGLRYSKDYKINELKASMRPENDTLNSLGKTDMRLDLRKRIKNFVIDKGYDKLSVKDFSDKVFNPRNVGAITNRMSFTHDFNAYEAKKAEDMALQRELEAQQKAMQRRQTVNERNNVRNANNAGNNPPEQQANNANQARQRRQSVGGNAQRPRI